MFFLKNQKFLTILAVSILAVVFVFSISYFFWKENYNNSNALNKEEEKEVLKDDKSEEVTENSIENIQGKNKEEEKTTPDENQKEGETKDNNLSEEIPDNNFNRPSPEEWLDI